MKSAMRHLAIAACFMLATTQVLAEDLSIESGLSYKYFQYSIVRGEVGNNRLSSMLFNLSLPINRNIFVDSSIQTAGLSSLALTTIFNQGSFIDSAVGTISLGLGYRKPLSRQLDTALVVSYLRLNNNAAFLEVEENAFGLAGRLRYFINPRFELQTSLGYSLDKNSSNTTLNFGSFLNVHRTSFGLTYHLADANTNAYALNIRRNF